nr:hypothetical protein [uncultured Flavobacterium sp.]
MKKVILFSMVLFSMISCSTDKNDEIVKEASVKVLFKNNNSLTGKNIQRGLIPVTVDIINIHTQKNGESLFIDYPFSLVDNGTVGADTEFVLRNLQMGTVNFSVFTNGGFGSGSFGQGNGSLYYGERMIVAEMGSLQSVFDKYSIIKPGIVFTATGTKEMIAGINEPITFNLNPANGRIISIYTLSQELKDLNYTAKIEAIWSGDAVLNKDNCVVRYEGTKACYYGNGNIADETVTIFDEMGQVVAVFVVKPNIVNGESTNTIYTVTENNIPAATLISPTIFVPDFKNDLPSNSGI